MIVTEVSIPKEIKDSPIWPYMQKVLNGERVIEGIVPCPDGEIREWLLKPADALTLKDINNFFAKLPGGGLRYDDLDERDVTNGIRLIGYSSQAAHLTWCLSHHSMRYLTETYSDWLATMDRCIAEQGVEPIDFGTQLRLLRSGVKVNAPGDEKWDQIALLVLPIYKEMRNLGYTRRDLEP